MEFLIGALAVCGLLTLLWCVTALLLFPAADRDMAVVWSVEGDCPELEYRVRAYLWLCRAGIFRARLVLTDCGMTEDARRRANHLAKDYSFVELADRAEETACPR